MGSAVGSGIPASPNAKWMNMTQTGGAFGGEDNLPRISFLDVFNYLKHMPGHSVEIDRGAVGAAARGTWKLKSVETTEL